MTPKEIVEGEKIIAEFMDYEYVPASIPVDYSKISGWVKKKNSHSLYEWMMGDDTIPPRRHHLGRTHYDLLFSNNWSWIMPVVKKLEKLDYVVIFYHGHCNIQTKDSFTNKSNNQWHIVTDDERGDSLRALFIALVEFIKWYNKNKTEK